ncbi:MAG: hypothetical protein IPO18_01555 [bacterium]|nr:hypothetical protein [bacterium]
MAPRQGFQVTSQLLALAILCGCDDKAPVVPMTLVDATVPVQLPGLTGDYSLGGSLPSTVPSTRSIAFRIPDEVRSIRELRLTLLGTWESGQRVHCRPVGNSTVCDTLPQYIGVSMRLTAASVGNCAFEAMWGVTDLGHPELLTASCPADSVDINLLLGQEITVELTCVTGDWPVTDLVVACSGTLSTVVLEVDGQVPEVVATTNRVDSTRR